MTLLNSGFPVPLTSKAWNIAQSRVQPQFDADHNQQQFRHGLALYAVEFYLRCMAFNVESKPAPILAQFIEGAELAVKNLGILECCPVQTGDTSVQVPVDAWCDRLAYVVVHIEDHFKQAQIIGFSSQPIPPHGKIHLSQLQTVDALPQYLYDCKTTALSQVWFWAKEQGQALAESVGGTLQGWQLTQDLTLAFMGADGLVTSAIESNLTASSGHAQVSKIVQLNDLDLELVMDLSPKEDGSLRIELMVESKQAVPDSVQLAVIDEAGQIFQQIVPADDCVAHPFSALPRERFSVELSDGETKHTENFVI
jgi:hypothetical protein